MSGNTKIFKLKIYSSEWVGEIVSNIFDRMIEKKLMPKDEEKAQQFISIIAEEIEKWGEQIRATKELEKNIKH